MGAGTVSDGLDGVVVGFLRENNEGIGKKRKSSRRVEGRVRAASTKTQKCFSRGCPDKIVHASTSFQNGKVSRVWALAW